MKDSERFCVWRFKTSETRIETRRQYYMRQLLCGSIKRLPNDLLPPHQRTILVDVPALGGAVLCHEESEVF